MNEKKSNLTSFVHILLMLSLAGCASTQPPDRQPGQAVVCHGEKTIVVSTPDFLRHVEHGDAAGACSS